MLLFSLCCCSKIKQDNKNELSSTKFSYHKESENNINNEDDIVVGEFSYWADSSYWIDGEIGIKRDGFKNTTESEIKSAKDALKLAKNELTVSYNKTAVCFDNETKIWRVDFWTENMDGGDMSVYLNSNGTTKICIWGE